MPVRAITNSSKVSALGFKAHFSLSTGKLLIDLSPTIWKTGGAASVVGAALIVVSPSGQIMSSGSSNVFTPPMGQTVQLDLPQFGGAYEWGDYQFRLTLDEGGSVLRSFDDLLNLCAPGDDDKIHGKQCIEHQSDCDQGVLRLYAGSTKYKGFTALSWTNNFQYYYPQSAGMSPAAVTRFPIEVDLVSGWGRIVGSALGYFDLGNNYFVTAQYDVDKEIFTTCEFPCYLWCAYTDLIKAVSQCEYGSPEHQTKYDQLMSVQIYISAVMFGHKCGNDISEFVAILEDLLNVQNQCPPVVIGTTMSTTTTTTTGGTTTTSTGGTTTQGTTTTTTQGTSTTTTTIAGCPAVMDIVASFGGVAPLANVYFGSRSAFAVPNQAEILGASQSAQDPNGTVNIDWTGVGSPKFLWFAIPAPITKATWFATLLNNGSIGTPDDLFDVPTVVNVSGVNYNVYVSNYQTQFSQIVQIS